MSPRFLVRDFHANASFGAMVRHVYGKMSAKGRSRELRDMRRRLYGDCWKAVLDGRQLISNFNL